MISLNVPTISRFLPGELADATEQVVRRAQRSLVVLHNGRLGIGAGVIWERSNNKGAFILTNQHVVAQGRQLRVMLAESSQRSNAEYPARLVATDDEIDLALLHIDASDLPPAEIGDSRKARVGQFVLALGHPWGQRGVVTAGLISGLSVARTRGRRDEVEVIRSDARLAPGNSGGPLLDASGAVLGINTMVVGGDQGIAIPSHVADEFVRQALKEQGCA
jgi:serine protease Do